MYFNNPQITKKMKSELIDFITNMGCQLNVHFNCNKEVTLDSGKRMLKLFDAMMSKKLLGTLALKKNKRDKRMIWMVFPEHTTTGKLHYHGHIFFPYKPQIQIMQFLNWRDKIWKKVCKGGHIEVSSTPTADHIKKAANYNLKEFWREGQRQNWIISTEFQS